VRGVAIHRTTKEEYMSWFAARPANPRGSIHQINPRAQKLLVATVRTFLTTLGDKDAPVDGIFWGDDPKN